MTVRELIEKLQHTDPDAIVCVFDWDDGPEEVGFVTAKEGPFWSAKTGQPTEGKYVELI